MCSRSCTRVFSEPTYGLKVSFVYVYKTRLLLYKATTLQGATPYRQGLEYTVILVSGEIMKPANIAKARKKDDNILLRH